MSKINHYQDMNESKKDLRGVIFSILFLLSTIVIVYKFIILPGLPVDCTKEPNLDKEDGCYNKAAERKHDLIICSNISNSWFRGSCFNRMAGNPSDCDRIPDADYVLWCKAVRNKDTIKHEDVMNFCNRITSSKIKMWCNGDILPKLN
jgi:hypothetical protein